MMGTQFMGTKLVVRDVPLAERFYAALGLKVVHRNVGGEGNVRQEQSWLSDSGSADEHILILTRFLEMSDAPTPAYPGETWLCLRVDDVDATCAQVQEQGGEVLRAGEDQPAYGVRAAVVADHEGHRIELVGPIK